MHLGIRKSQDDDGNVPDFRTLAQSFWKEKGSKPSPGKDSARATDNYVGYVGGHFQGTFTNKDIERMKQESAVQETESDSQAESNKPAIHYERYFS